MSFELHFLRDLLLLFSLASLVVVICHHIRLPAIVGFLLTGVIAGPYGLKLISEPESVKSLAEIGVVLLLFTIGIEFSLQNLYRIRAVMLLGGTLQMLLTGGLMALVSGLFFQLTVQQAIFLGMLIALSSTAIVLKILSDKAEVDSPHGRISLAILIFQDLCVVPMMIVTPYLSGQGGTFGDMAWKLAKALLMVGGVLLCGRFVIPIVLKQVVRTRNREVFLLVIILLCLGTAWLSALAGLSLALGAFMAGLIISQSEYSHQALGEIIPFRDALSSLFLISIGMLLNIRTLAQPALVLGGVLAMVAIKQVVASGLTLALGYSFRVAFLVGAGLAQIGEFSFLLAREGHESGLLDDHLYQLFLAASALTMTLTPFLNQIAPKIAEKLEPYVPKGFLWPGKEARGSPAAEKLKDHVIILGFGPTGRNLANVLKHVSVPYVVIEMNPETVANEKRKGEPILYGDVARPEVLEHAGIHEARILVIAISDPSSVRRSTQLARQLNPGLHILVRTRYLQEMEPLLKLGANEVVPEEFETSLEIFSRTLRKLLVPRDQVERFIREARQNGYGVLRAEPSVKSLPYGVKGLVAGADLEVFRVEPGSALAGKTLGEVPLRRETGATILAIGQGNDFLLNPPASVRLEPESNAIVFGTPEQISKAAELFRAKN